MKNEENLISIFNITYVFIFSHKYLYIIIICNIIYITFIQVKVNIYLKNSYVLKLYIEVWL